MEDEEKIQINMKKKAKQAKEEAKLKAAREKAREHQTKSVDFSELYGSLAPDLVQLSALDHDNDTDDLLETNADMPKPVVEEEPAEDQEE